MLGEICMVPCGGVIGLEVRSLECFVFGWEELRIGLSLNVKSNLACRICRDTVYIHWR